MTINTHSSLQLVHADIRGHQLGHVWAIKFNFLEIDISLLSHKLCVVAVTFTRLYSSFPRVTYVTLCK